MGKLGYGKHRLNNGSTQTIYKANSQTNLISVSLDSEIYCLSIGNLSIGWLEWGVLGKSFIEL